MTLAWSVVYVMTLDNKIHIPLAQAPSSQLFSSSLSIGLLLLGLPPSLLTGVEQKVDDILYVTTKTTTTSLRYFTSK